MNNITNYYGDLGIFLYYTPIVSAFMAAFALLVGELLRKRGWLLS